MLVFLEQVVLSFVSALGFSVIIRVPRKELLYSGMSGSLGWVSYWLTGLVGLPTTAGTFVGAFSIAYVSYLFARHRRTPATLYNIPGIFALVPGGSSYQMTYNLIIGEYHQAVYYGIRVVALAGAIAGGLLVFDLIRRNLRTPKLVRRK